MTFERTWISVAAGGTREAMDVVKRIVRGVGRVLRTIGREFAATIRFGAVPASIEPGGLNRNVNVTGVVAGLPGLSVDGPEQEPVEDD